jgi:mannose-6-phosphate isomerase-like protein (cupin superfamily)
MKLLALALAAFALCAFALSAGDPQGFYMWTSAELKGYAKTLAPKMSDKKVASQTIAANGNYSFMAAHREGSGEAELHTTQADVFVVETGEATITIGGELVDGKTTAPNELRAASIKGGSDKKLAAGDVLTIPAKVAHQMKLDPGKQITYFVVKVTQ